MTPAPEYRRLPGRSGLLIRHSLWMKPDHLLRVRANPFSQQYRRYYFADIQAVVLTELHGTAALYWYAAAISLVLISAFLIYSAHQFWGVVAAIFALLAFVLGRRIPDCNCHLKTSVGTDKIPSIRRLRTARRAVPMVISEIEKVQGVLSHETLEAHQTLGSVSVDPQSTVPISHYGGLLHWILCALMLLDAALSGIVWTTRSQTLSVIAGASGAATLLLAILAAFKQRRTDTPPSLRWIVYSTLVLYPLNSIASVAASIYLTLQLAAKGVKNPDPMAILTQPLLRIIVIANITWLVVLGCIGLVLLMLRKQSMSAPPPLIVSETSTVEADRT
jgi:hypothetical protein